MDLPRAVYSRDLKIAAMGALDAGPPPPVFRPLSRRSGCVPAEPYPPPRYFQRALYQLRRATNSAANGDYLTGCLTMKWLFRFHFARPFRLPLVGRGAGWTYRVLLIGT